MKKVLCLLLVPLTIAMIMAFAKPVGGYEVGDKIEEFNLKNVDGSRFSLSSVKEAQGFIVVFTCNTCPYARKYEQRIINLHNKYAAQGYPVVAINPNYVGIVPGDSYEEMKKRATAKKYPFVYLADEDGLVCYKFGATKTPHVYLLDKNKVVKYIGAIDDNADDVNSASKKYVEMAIEALKKGKNPEPSLTKAVGCEVKRKGMDP